MYIIATLRMWKKKIFMIVSSMYLNLVEEIDIIHYFMHDQETEKA